MANLRRNLLVVILFSFALAEARNKLPLVDEEHGRIRNKAAECVFGKQIKELGSQWIPDLGVPIGVLYCMKCECIPLQRKHRIVARVSCRNIQNECPEPTCKEPVSIPGRCCKTCPGDSYDRDVIKDIVKQNVDDSEKSVKHYVALLTGRSSMVINDHIQPYANENNVVATGRFSFHRKNLHYSFYISDKAARPRTLYFRNEKGDILEEFTLSHPGGLVTSVYQNATRKVCGVWKRLPKPYKTLLKQEKLFVTLVWGISEQAEFKLSGQLMKHNALGTELFSSLLESAPGTDQQLMAGSGGTAIVSTSTSVSPSIHVAIIFNGIFTPEETSEVPVNITLSVDEKKHRILQEVVRVPKPSSQFNIVEVKTVVSPSDLRLLTRGRLLLSISSVSHPGSLKLSGNVITKTTCELFQSTLSSSGSANNPNGTSGLAWLYLNNEGSLVYNIQIDKLPKPAIITLVDASTKRKTELEDLTPEFVNGWANGTLHKLGPKVLEPLYAGNLAVNVATEWHSSLIRGKLIAKPVADARDAAAPFLMKRDNNFTLPPSAVGMAWISVDNDCNMHYDISMTGIGGNNKHLELYLELLPMIAPGAPVTTIHFTDFEGHQVEGSRLDSLSKDELNLLDGGVGFLKVRDRDSKAILLVATVRQVKIPPSCRPQYTDNNLPALFDHPEEINTGGACYYEGRFYDEDTQWVSVQNPCTMCFCQNGVSKCDTMTCPDIKCPYGIKVNISEECCPICSDALNDTENNTTMPKKCKLNGRDYYRGSKFHPFLIPNGFDTCTECTCDPKFMEIKCARLNDNEGSCCKNCNKQDPSENESYVGADIVPLLYNDSTTVSPHKVLSEGGCENTGNPSKPYPNGSQYHPFIDSLGEYKCVTCKCQNGKLSCKRKSCDPSTCSRLFEMKRKRIHIYSHDTCCSLKECRKLKHKKNRPHNSISWAPK